MRTRVPALLILAALMSMVVVPVDGAPVPKDKKSADAERLVGRWRVVGREYNGGPRSGKEEFFWIFEAETMTIVNSNTDRGTQSTYQIHEFESPKMLDLLIGKSKYEGLYELDGNTLKWANTGPGGKRPLSVSSANNVNLIIFARE